MKTPLHNQRGIALLLTLVILVLLVVLIVEFDYGTKINLITAGNFRDDVRATYLAKSGVAAAQAVLKDDAKNHEGEVSLNCGNIAKKISQGGEKGHPQQAADNIK